MKIYNKNKTLILENVDLNKGYLIDDKIITGKTPAQPEQPEQYHYEFKHYENGGVDRIKIVDVPYNPPIDEQPIYEDIKVYVEYTEKELAEKEYFNLKNWFDVDYARLEQKFRRLHTLGKDYKGKSAYDALIDLYNHAEEVRAKINELEAIIDS